MKLWDLLTGRSAFSARVRDEIDWVKKMHGDQAHSYVLQKLERRELTSHYRAIMQEVERALRPGAPHQAKRGWPRPAKLTGQRAVEPSSQRKTANSGLGDSE